MKIAVEILCTKFEPSARNVAAIKKTYILLCGRLMRERKLKHKYDFYFYYSDPGAAEEIFPDSDYPNCYNLPINCDESIYKTFEKGIYALNHTGGYDWYIRTNISSYLNIQVLDRLVEQFNEDTVYCNALNTYTYTERYCNNIYPRGDLMIFSSKVKDGILAESAKYIGCDTFLTDRIEVTHVDDCMFGICLIDYFGKGYYRHLEMMKYNYFPEPEPTISKKIFYGCIGNRLKTIPPNIRYSGYSWKDNEWRKLDVNKMEFLNSEIEKFNYDGIDISLKDVLSDRRGVLFTRLENVNIADLKRYLEIKEREQ